MKNFDMKSIITIAAILLILLVLGMIAHLMVNGLPEHVQQFLQ